MKKLRCKKEFGVWYYIKEKPEKYGTCTLDASVYYLYNEEKQYEECFGSYNDMKYYVETGIVLA